MRILETWATVVGLASGFALLGYKQRPAELLATSIAVNLALAPLTAIIASRRGRSTTAWAIIGLCFGAWALAASLLLLPSSPGGPHNSDPNQFPSTPHAA